MTTQEGKKQTDGKIYTLWTLTKESASGYINIRQDSPNTRSMTRLKGTLPQEKTVNSYHQNKKAVYWMGEDTCKWYIQ